MSLKKSPKDHYWQKVEFAHTQHGAMFYLPQDTYVGGSLREYGCYSPDECQMLRKIMRPHWTVIDCGANTGVITLELARLCKQVYAVEPQYMFNQLTRANVAINDLNNVEVLYNAVGAEAKVVTIPTFDYDHPENYGAIGHLAWTKGLEVEQVTLDQMVSFLNIPEVNFLKVDVEGMEKDVLIGASTLIKRDYPLLFVENDRPENSKELIEYIYSLQYTPYWVVTLVTRDEKSPYFGQCSFNMLCTPPEGRNRLIVEQLNQVQPDDVIKDYPMNKALWFQDSEYGE